MQPDNFVTRYIHENYAHNLGSPSIIVPFLIERLKPSSVIDIGCGIGTFLHEFKNHGVSDVLGIDGKWVDKRQLYISEHEFLEANLEEPLEFDKVYDLVLCLEVAEHLSPSAAEVLVDSLCLAGKRIVFSAAIDKQGGQNHTNEQSFSYWKGKFEAKGYRAIDLFRPHFWHVENVQWWYKQNMFLIVHETVDTAELESSIPNFSVDDLMIHPGLYYERIKDLERKSAELNRIGSGEAGNFNFYLGLLYRSFLKMFRSRT